MDTMASILAAIAVSADETIASQNVINNEGIQFAIRLSGCLHCSSCVAYLTLPVSNCSGERSFSLLKRIKNASRSTIAQDRLRNLTLRPMNLECEIEQALDFQDLVDSFAIVKARRQ